MYYHSGRGHCLLFAGDTQRDMPLLCAEREKSFIRLQEEIMKESDDHSLFAWWHPAHDETHDGDFSRWKHTDMLAQSPSMFASSGDIVTFQNPHSKHHIMTNRGLLIDLCIREEILSYAVFATAILNCHRSGDLNHFFALDFIKRGYQQGESAQWSRLHNPRGGPLLVSRTERTAFKNTPIYVKLTKTLAPSSGLISPSARSGGLLFSQIDDFTAVKVETAQIWDQNTQSVQVYRQPRTHPTTIFFQHKTGYGINSPIGPGQIVVVTFELGFDQNLRPLNVPTIYSTKWQARLILACHRITAFWSSLVWPLLTLPYGLSGSSHEAPQSRIFRSADPLRRICFRT
ncbi:hypothetical protein EG328_007100 [Venturia inaequalis]|uniref:DUF8212 domain-containing protein n=1 Tax=Venturia inaequalis TaxID=5025 RepID=A0A8H3UFJ4_VENIN|nr:hypothetical protein EG328_007100 [Venturia inaequalis]